MSFRLRCLKSYGGLLLLSLTPFLGCESPGHTDVKSVAALSSQRRGPPSITAELSGPPETVFNTRNSCEQIDIPDAIPRAFRDYNNVVHLVATHYVARAMVGPSLDLVKHDCRVLYSSPHYPDPGDFLDANWLDSFFTEDGREITALVHTEYHGDEHPGECGNPLNPNHSQNCAWTTITAAESRDGGYTFKEPTPPANLVASLPYVYDKNNMDGTQGYGSPTNILKRGLYYYSFINVWREYKAQRYGPCLIRTATLSDPTSWRGWDGRDFTVRFIDPYRERGIDPAHHVCFPIVAGTIDSLSVDEQIGAIIGDAYVEDDRYGRGPGLYVFASYDLVHWSSPNLVVSTEALRKAEPPGQWAYLYFSLLDPEAKDRNFATVSRMPYVYYVRLDNNHGPYTRVLLRRRIKISISSG